MSDQSKQPWWIPVPTDAAWLTRIRSEYPEHADDSDEELREYFAHGRKYAVLWDHVGDAYGDYQPLADAYLAQQEEIRQLKDQLAQAQSPNERGPRWASEEHIVASPETRLLPQEGSRWLGNVYGEDDDWRIFAVPIRAPGHE